MILIPSRSSCRASWEKSRICSRSRHPKHDFMSDSGTKFPWTGSGPPGSLTPFLKALKSRDLETLSKLRHALRTPLNQIIGYSEMLMESAEENNASAIVPDLKRIHSSGGQLLAVINDALAPWKIDTGRIDFPAMRQAMQSPLGAVVNQAGLCLERSRASGHSELVKDLEKILTAAQNLEKLFDSDAYSEEIIVGRPVGTGGTEPAESPLGAVV